MATNATASSTPEQHEDPRLPPRASVSFAPFHRSHSLRRSRSSSDVSSIALDVDQTLASSTSSHHPTAVAFPRKSGSSDLAHPSTAAAVGFYSFETTAIRTPSVHSLAEAEEPTKEGKGKGAATRAPLVEITPPPTASAYHPRYQQQQFTTLSGHSEHHDSFSSTSSGISGGRVHSSDDSFDDVFTARHRMGGPRSNLFYQVGRGDGKGKGNHSSPDLLYGPLLTDYYKSVPGPAPIPQPVTTSIPVSGPSFPLPVLGGPALFQPSAVSTPAAERDKDRTIGKAKGKSTLFDAPPLQAAASISRSSTSAFAIRPPAIPSSFLPPAQSSKQQQTVSSYTFFSPPSAAPPASKNAPLPASSSVPVPVPTPSSITSSIPAPENSFATVTKNTFAFPSSSSSQQQQQHELSSSTSRLAVPGTEGPTSEEGDFLEEPRRRKTSSFSSLRKWLPGGGNRSSSPSGNGNVDDVEKGTVLEEGGRDRNGSIGRKEEAVRAAALKRLSDSLTSSLTSSFFSSSISRSPNPAPASLPSPSLPTYHQHNGNNSPQPPPPAFLSADVFSGDPNAPSWFIPAAGSPSPPLPSPARSKTASPAFGGSGASFANPSLGQSTMRRPTMPTSQNDSNAFQTVSSVSSSMYMTAYGGEGDSRVDLTTPQPIARSMSASPNPTHSSSSVAFPSALASGPAPTAQKKLEDIWGFASPLPAAPSSATTLPLSEPLSAPASLSSFPAFPGGGHGAIGPGAGKRLFGAHGHGHGHAVLQRAPVLSVIEGSPLSAMGGHSVNGHGGGVRSRTPSPSPLAAAAIVPLPTATALEFPRSPITAPVPVLARTVGLTDLPGDWRESRSRSHSPPVLAPSPAFMLAAPAAPVSSGGNGGVALSPWNSPPLSPITPTGPAFFGAMQQQQSVGETRALLPPAEVAPHSFIPAVQELDGIPSPTSPLSPQSSTEQSRYDEDFEGEEDYEILPRPSFMLDDESRTEGTSSRSARRTTTTSWGSSAATTMTITGGAGTGRRSSFLNSLRWSNFKSVGGEGSVGSGAGGTGSRAGSVGGMSITKIPGLVGAGAGTGGTGNNVHVIAPFTRHSAQSSASGSGSGFVFGRGGGIQMRPGGVRPRTRSEIADEEFVSRSSTPTSTEMRSLSSLVHSATTNAGAPSGINPHTTANLMRHRRHWSSRGQEEGDLLPIESVLGKFTTPAASPPPRPTRSTELLAMSEDDGTFYDAEDGDDDGEIRSSREDGGRAGSVSVSSALERGRGRRWTATTVATGTTAAMTSGASTGASLRQDHHSQRDSIVSLSSPRPLILPALVQARANDEQHQRHSSSPVFETFPKTSSPHHSGSGSGRAVRPVAGGPPSPGPSPTSSSSSGKNAPLASSSTAAAAAALLPPEQRRVRILSGPRHHQRSSPSAPADIGHTPPSSLALNKPKGKGKRSFLLSPPPTPPAAAALSFPRQQNAYSSPNRSLASSTRSDAPIQPLQYAPSPVEQPGGPIPTSYLVQHPLVALDVLLPAQSLFILGFLLGPWAWLVGGYLLDSDGEVPSRDREGAVVVGKWIFARQNRFNSPRSHPSRSRNETIALNDSTSSSAPSLGVPHTSNAVPRHLRMYERDVAALSTAELMHHPLERNPSMLAPSLPRLFGLHFRARMHSLSMRPDAPNAWVWRCRAASLMSGVVIGVGLTLAVLAAVNGHL